MHGKSEYLFDEFAKSETKVEYKYSVDMSSYPRYLVGTCPKTALPKL